MLQSQYVYGAIPFTNKKEKDYHWRQLRREHGEGVKIKIDNGLLIYSYRDLAS